MNNTSRRIPRIQNAIAFVFGREDFRFEWKKILRCEERERERERERKSLPLLRYARLWLMLKIYKQ